MKRIAITAAVALVRQGPEGSLYLLTDSPQGRILKLVPKA